MLRMSRPDWRGPEKDETRRTLLTRAVQHVVAASADRSPKRDPKDLRALILVDGCVDPPHAEDLRTLVELGVPATGVWAVSRAWREEVRALYGGAHIIEGELSTFIAESDQPVFDIVYLDFCKSLPSEGPRRGRERHVASLFHLFRRRRVAELGVLITNFSVESYFDDPHYRDFIATYVSPDFGGQPNGVRHMSARTMVMGETMYFGPAEKLFDRERKASSPGDTSIQEALVLLAGMDGFVRDLAEVYVPSIPFREIRDHRALARLDEPTGPEGMGITVRSLCQGRAGVCARLLEGLDPTLRADLEPYTGTSHTLWLLSLLSDAMWAEFAVFDAYMLDPLAAFPYPFPTRASRERGDPHTMLPIMWDVRLVPLLNSQRLWGEDAARRRVGWPEVHQWRLTPVPAWAHVPEADAPLVHEEVLRQLEAWRTADAQAEDRSHLGESPASETHIADVSQPPALEPPTPES